MKTLGLTFLCGSIAVAACGTDAAAPGPDANTTEVSIALTAVPAMVTCIKVQPTVNGMAQAPVLTTVTLNASTAALSLGRLPTGAATFTGAAYSVACTDPTINTTAVPLWVADSVTATLSVGVATTVSMTFRLANPVVVSASFVKSVTSISTGDYATYAVMSDGTVKAWGSTSAGVGTLTVPTDFPGATSVAEVATGSSFGCLRTTAGAVQCWGNLPGSTGASAPTPTAVTLPGPALKIAAGELHICALVKLSSTNMPVYCWGRNDDGQLGNATWTTSTTPVQVYGINNAVALAVGGYNSCALTSSNYVFCWGYGGYSMLGNGSASSASAPVTASTTIAVKSLSLGYSTACAVGVDGRVQCWGSLTGDGTGTARSSPVLVSGLSDAVTVGIGMNHVCALRRTGQVVCWGYDMQGQTASTNVAWTYAPGPALTGFAAPVVDVSAHESNHTCALLQDGSVSCWGANDSGQLGDGTIATRWAPTPALIN